VLTNSRDIKPLVVTDHLAQCPWINWSWHICAMESRGAGGNIRDTKMMGGVIQFGEKA